MARIIFRALANAVMLASIFGQSASANDREAAFANIIGHYTTMATALRDEAVRRKAPHAGSMLNEIGLHGFKCASLAYLLGKDDVFKRLPHIGEPEMKPRMLEKELLALTVA
jgi:hypothetical protein